MFHSFCKYPAILTAKQKYYLLRLMLYLPVNSYGHVGKSVHLTTLFFVGKLD